MLHSLRSSAWIKLFTISLFQDFLQQFEHSTFIGILLNSFEHLWETRIQKIMFPVLLFKRTPNLILILLHYYFCAFLHSAILRVFFTPHLKFTLLEVLLTFHIFLEYLTKNSPTPIFWTNMQGITHCFWHFLEFLFLLYNTSHSYRLCMQVWMLKQFV